MFRDQNNPEPIEYCDIVDPKFQGKGIGEIIKDPVYGGYSLHLRTTDQTIREGKKLAQAGDIVIMGISKKGWDEIGKIVGTLKPDAKMTDVRRAISESPIIAAVKPSTGH